MSIQEQIRKEFPGVKLWITPPFRGISKIDKIIVPESLRGQRIGSRIMEKILTWADRNNITLALTPDPSFGGSVPRLKKFYGRFGFVLNKGENKDYEIMELMYRYPKSSRLASVDLGKSILQIRFETEFPLTLIAEAASSESQKSKGLMFRKKLPPNQCMLFPFRESKERTFWMKNTYLPLDIIFVGPDRKILNIEPGFPLNKETSVKSKEPCKYVIETNQGFCAQNHIQERTKVRFLKKLRKSLESQVQSKWSI